MKNATSGAHEEVREGSDRHAIQYKKMENHLDARDLKRTRLEPITSLHCAAHPSNASKYPLPLRTSEDTTAINSGGTKSDKKRVRSSMDSGNEKDEEESEAKQARLPIIIYTNRFVPPTRLIAVHMQDSFSAALLHTPRSEVMKSLHQGYAGMVQRRNIHHSTRSRAGFHLGFVP